MSFLLPRPMGSRTSKTSNKSSSIQGQHMNYILQKSWAIEWFLTLALLLDFHAWTASKCSWLLETNISGSNPPLINIWSTETRTHTQHAFPPPPRILCNNRVNWREPCWLLEILVAHASRLEPRGRMGKNSERKKKKKPSAAAGRYSRHRGEPLRYTERSMWGMLPCLVKDSQAHYFMLHICWLP